jgi:predicted permease
VAGAGLVQTILTFAGIVAVGALLRMSGVVGREDTRPLNAVIIYVGLPAFVFQAVHGAELGSELFGVVAVAWAAIAVSALAAVGFCKALDLPPAIAGGVILTASLGNTGYIGYPVAAAVLGTSAVPSAVFYDVFGTVLALVLVGIPIAQRFGAADGKRVDPIRELVTFPAVIALALALVLGPVEIPTALGDGLDLCANLVAPLIMLSVGISLRPRSAWDWRGPVLGVTAIKLVLAPLVALALGALILADSESRLAVLQAGMPTMMLSLVVGERFGLETDLIAAAIFVTTVLSAVTLPLFQYLAF